MPVIAFTFAGRKKRMSLQVDYMRQALEQSSINQWHIWNFARNSNDHEWLQTEFKDCHALYTSATSLEYSHLLSPKDTKCNFWVKARNDAHIIIQMKSGEIYELVLGAYENTKNLLRWFPDIEALENHAPPIQIDNGSLVWNHMNEIQLDCHQNLTVTFNNSQIFKEKLNDPLDFIEKISVHSGYGSDGFWDTNIKSNIKLINTSQSGYEGFKRVYNYYSNSYYSEDIFIKMDDDIVYCDLKKINPFIETIANSKSSNIISANVINNGVCAHLQYLDGYFNSSNLVFNYPPEGLCGELWESSVLCSDLHAHFLKNFSAIHDIASKSKAIAELPDFDRFSINFIGFKHKIFVYMSAAYYSNENQKDDEFIMTKTLPKLFGVKKYVFTPLLVSHLSFYKQEENLNPDSIIDEYSKIDLS